MFDYSGSSGRSDNRSARQWFINLVVTLCAIFLAIVYEATMTASLVQEDYTADFTSIVDIKTCRILPEDICLPKGDAIINYWNAAVAAKYVAIFVSSDRKLTTSN